MMRRLSLPFVLLLLAVAPSLRAQTASAPDELRTQADAAMADQAYAEALALYDNWLETGDATSPAGQQVRFARAEAQIRRFRDETPEALLAWQAALEDLQRLLDEVNATTRSVFWAEVALFRGWVLLNLADEGIEGLTTADAWAAFRSGLETLAASTDLESARDLYVQTILDLATQTHSGRLLWRFQAIPEARAWLQNAYELSRTDEERAELALLRALLLDRTARSAEDRVRQGELFEEAVASAGESWVLPHALWQRAAWLERWGEASFNELGEMSFLPDRQGAAVLYEQLAELERPAGRNPYARRAREQAARLRASELNLFVTHNFRSDTEVSFRLAGRNLGAVSILIEPLDWTQPNPSETDWRPQPSVEPVYTATWQPRPERPLAPVEQVHRLPDSLPLGAYLVTVRSGLLEAQELLLVSDIVATFVADNQGAQVLWVTDADQGAPLPEAYAQLYHQERVPDEPLHRSWVASAVTDDDGLAPLPAGGVQANRIVTVDSPQGPALVRAWQKGPRTKEWPEWRLHAYSERPLYRPEETVHLRVMVRERTADGWRRPAAETLAYSLRDPEYEELQAGTLTLNEFGTASLEFTLPPGARLGQYRWVFQRADTFLNGNRYAFAVEEYRVPEFRVAVETTAETASLALGDTVEGTVQVDYYAGGGVPGAEVEVVIFQNRFRWWQPPWAFFARDVSRSHGVYEPDGQVVERLPLTTDAEGRATFSFATPRDSAHDVRYTIEARVTDASRREIIGQAEAIITAQPYNVTLGSPDRVYAPDEQIEVTVAAKNAAEAPVPASGTVRLTRETWRQTYVHRRRGNEITGEAFRALPRRSILGAAQTDFRLRGEGFVTEEIDRQPLELGADGEAIYQFAAPEAGYYRLSWISPGRRGGSITAETAFWVTDDATTRLGYRPGGIEIIGDAHSFRPGEETSVLIMTETPNRHVLLLKGAEVLESHELLYLEGNARLVRLRLTEADVPNTFLQVFSVHAEALEMDQLQISLPPDDQQLSLTLTPDAEGYEPQQTATYTLTARDAAGKPVVGEFSLAVTDQAVHDLATKRMPEIFARYYGDTRRWQLITPTSLNWRRFFEPVEIAEEGVAEQTFAAAPQGALRRSSPSVVTEVIYGDDGEELFTLSPFTVATVEDMGYESTSAGAASQLVPAVRADFQSTVYWSPTVVTDENGEATVRFTFPDNLTEWRVAAVGTTAETQVGQTQDHVTTRLPLMARLQLPRFLIEGDEAVLSGVFQNEAERALDLTTSLTVGAGLSLMNRADQDLRAPMDAASRADWTVTATAPGEPVVTLVATSDTLGDAMELPLPIHPHGMTVKATRSGLLPEEASAVTMTVPLPAERDPAQTEVTLSLAPSLAGTLLDSLPYLTHFPHACVEQTVSRFVPTVVTRTTLEDLGFSPEVVAQAALGLDALVDNETAAASADDLQAIIDESLQKLAEMRLPNGAWPWMPRGLANLEMTAYVMWALALAQDAGLEMRGYDFFDGETASYLGSRMVELTDDRRLQAWVLYALSSRYGAQAQGGRPNRLEARVFLDLFNLRAQLDSTGLAWLGMAARNFGFPEEARILLRNLVDGAQRESRAVAGATWTEGTGLEQPLVLETVSWPARWAAHQTERTAWALQAMLRIDPTHELITPTTRWLVTNRTGQRWDHTRATALATLALQEHLRARPSFNNPARYEVLVDGEVVDTFAVTPGDSILPRRLTVPVPDTGAPEVVVRRVGDGQAPLFFVLATQAYTREAPIQPSGDNLLVARSFERMRAVPTLLAGFREEGEPLPDEGSTVAGERLNVTLRLTAEQDTRYLVLTDPRAAGAEAVEQQSGWHLTLHEIFDERLRTVSRPRSLRAYVEWWERGMVAYLDDLPEGTWELTYPLRAETPGRFHALPATLEAFYLPTWQGNSAEMRLRVVEE